MPTGISAVVLRLLRERPGMTRDDLHAALADTGFARERSTVLARVSRLKRKGAIEERGGGLFDAKQLAEAIIAAAQHQRGDTP